MRQRETDLGEASQAREGPRSRGEPMRKIQREEKLHRGKQRNVPGVDRASMSSLRHLVEEKEHLL